MRSLWRIAIWCYAASLLGLIAVLLIYGREIEGAIWLMWETGARPGLVAISLCFVVVIYLLSGPVIYFSRKHH